MTGPKKLTSSSPPGEKVMIGVPTSCPCGQRELGLLPQHHVVALVLARGHEARRQARGRDRAVDQAVVTLADLGCAAGGVELLAERRVGGGDGAIAAVVPGRGGDAKHAAPTAVRVDVPGWELAVVVLLLVDHAQRDEAPLDVESRWPATSTVRRLVIHAHGQMGSKKNSRSAMSGTLTGARLTWRGAPPRRRPAPGGRGRSGRAPGGTCAPPRVSPPGERGDHLVDRAGGAVLAQLGGSRPMAAARRSNSPSSAPQQITSAAEYVSEVDRGRWPRTPRTRAHCSVNSSSGGTRG